MAAEDFTRALGTKGQPLASTIFERMDRNNSKTLSVDEFVESMLILRHGTVDDRLAFAFHLYDMDHSGTIEEADLVKLLRVCLSTELYILYVW